MTFSKRKDRYMKASRPPVPAVANNKKKRRMKPWLIVLIVVSVVLCTAAGVIAVNFNTSRQNAADRKTVAVCNGYEIPYEVRLSPCSTASGVRFSM